MISAEFEKRRLEGYDMSTPVLAIAVSENLWELYVVYATVVPTGFELHFVGPNSMGDTRGVEVAFKILHSMMLLS